MTAGTRHRDGLVMAGRAPRVSFSETLLQIPSSTILKKIEHNNTATRWFQRTQILSLKNTSFSAIQIWKIKIINPSFNETFPQASHRMTREKCSTKGAKAGCKAKDSWLLWGKILGAVLCTLEVREPQLKKRVWSWQFFFATQRRDDPRDDFVPKKKHRNCFTAWWANYKHPANTYKIVTALSPSYPSCLGSSDGEPQPDAAELKEGTLQSMIFCSKSTISRKDMGPV